MLAGVPDDVQATRLVGNIRRFLTGVGAPEVVNPAKIGSSQSPARNDPDVSERTLEREDGNGAVYPGLVYYAFNGPLARALGELDAGVSIRPVHAKHYVNGMRVPHTVDGNLRASHCQPREGQATDWRLRDARW